MDITTAEVERIAELARLELTPEEKTLYRGQLGHILSWAGRINAADIKAAPFAAPAAEPAPALREDAPAISGQGQAILQNARERELDFIKVQKVIE